MTDELNVFAPPSPSGPTASGATSAPSRAYPTAKDLLWWIPLSLATFIVAVLVVVVLAIAIGREVASHPALIPSETTASLAAIVGWSMWRGRFRLNHILRTTGTVTPATVLITIGGALGLQVLLSELDNLLRFLGTQLPSTLPEGLINDDPWSTLAVLGIAPVGEELVFRGILLRGFLKNYGPMKAILGSAAIFALYHLNPAQIPAALMVGILLGLAFAVTQSVWLTILVHEFFNGMLYVATASANVVPIPGYNQLNPDGSAPMTFQPWWLDLSAVALVVVAAYWLGRRLPSKAAPAG